MIAKSRNQCHHASDPWARRPLLSSMLSGIALVSASALSIPAHAQTPSPKAATQSEADLAPSGKFNAPVNGPRLPIMGWNPWNAFRTEVNEAKIMGAANRMVSSGLTSRGYRYINIDDGWWQRRDANGRLIVRTRMFPSAALPDGGNSFRPFVDRLHGLGLKVGIYSDIGRNACAQRWDPESPNLPEGSIAERQIGSMGFQREDVRLFFKDWGFDLVKLDACGLADFGAGEAHIKAGQYAALTPLIVRGKAAETDEAGVEALYAGFADAMRQEGLAHDHVLSICAWGEASVNNWAKNYGTMWRTAGDIRPTWKSMLASFDSAAPRTLFAGPGHWNDPDMLVVGLGEFDANQLTEARTHFSLWTILSAPLILGNDIEHASASIIDLVGNPEVIAINQDAAGHAGSIVSRDGDVEIVVKTLTGTGERALALVNRGNTTATASVHLNRIGLRASGAKLRDVWQKRDMGRSNGQIAMSLAPRETKLLRVSGRPITSGGIYLSEAPAFVNIAVDGTKYLGDALPKNWVPARVDYAPSGDPIVINGRRIDHAIGILNNSRIEVKLGKSYRRFDALPAIIGAAGEGVTVRIYGDGRLLRERRLVAGLAATPITVDLRNVDVLELVAQGDGGTAGHTPLSIAWGNAALR